MYCYYTSTYNGIIRILVLYAYTGVIRILVLYSYTFNVFLTGEFIILYRVFQELRKLL